MSSLVRGLVGADVVDGDGKAASSVVSGGGSTSAAPSASSGRSGAAAMSTPGGNIQLLSLISADGIKQMGVTRVPGLLKPHSEAALGPEPNIHMLCLVSCSQSRKLLLKSLLAKFLCKAWQR